MKSLPVGLALAFGILAATEGAAQICGPKWYSDPPAKVYRGGALRLHFTPYESSGDCNTWIFNIGGARRKAILEGETDPVEFDVRQLSKGVELVQDWYPVDGWASRSRVGFPIPPLPDIPAGCYPVPSEGGGFVHFDIIDGPYPPVDISSVTVKDAFNTVGCEEFTSLSVTPFQPDFIYWISITSTAGTETLWHMPERQNPFNTGVPELYFEMMKPGCHTDQCNTVFGLHLCEALSISVQAESVNWSTGTATAPIEFTAGVQYFSGTGWRYGDPLDCATYDAGFYDAGPYGDGPACTGIQPCCCRNDMDYSGPLDCVDGGWQCPPGWAAACDRPNYFCNWAAVDGGHEVGYGSGDAGPDAGQVHPHDAGIGADWEVSSHMCADGSSCVTTGCACSALSI